MKWFIIICLVALSASMDLEHASIKDPRITGVSGILEVNNSTANATRGNLHLKVNVTAAFDLPTKALYNDLYENLRKSIQNEVMESMHKRRLETQKIEQNIIQQMLRFSQT